MKLKTFIPLLCLFLISCNQDRELIINDPSGSADQSQTPTIRPVRQDGSTRLVRRNIDHSDPCFTFIYAEKTKVLASCYVVLDSLVSPAYREMVSEASLCVMKRGVGDKELLAIEGNILSEGEKGAKTRHYFSQALEYKTEENVLKVEFVQGKHKVWFEFVDQGIKDFPLLKFTRRTKVFRKRINKAALECFPEYIPEN